MPSKQHRMRSLLFTPAMRPERFRKAAEVGADVLIVDLEDSIAPEEKDAARENAMEFLASRELLPGVTIALRINGLDTRAGLADLSALLDSEADPALLILPKTESAGYLRILDRQLNGAAKATRIVGQIESVPGLVAAAEIARATSRLDALMFGCADMSADLGAETSWEPLLYARSRLIFACAEAGIPALDAPFFDLRDNAGLKEEAARSKALGFVGKCAIHPGQVGVINDAFTPTDQAVLEARAILVENAKGVGVVNGRMVDEAVARNARRVLAAAGEDSADTEDGRG